MVTHLVHHDGWLVVAPMLIWAASCLIAVIIAIIQTFFKR